MFRRSLAIACTLAAIFAVPACGPTKAGLEARQNARDRLDAFSANFTLDQARQEYEAGQFERALRAVEQSINQSPNCVECFVLKGRIHLETHELEQAIEAFEDAIHRDPDAAEANYFAGIVMQRWSRDAEALAYYRRAYELAPENVQYLMATAETLVALQELDEAHDLVSGKLAYFEHNPAMRQLLGHIALLQNDPAEAAELLGQARLLKPDDTMLLEELAWAQFDAGQFEQCYDTVTILQAKLEEQRPDLMQIEGRCLSMLERTAEAHHLYMRLSQLNPGDPTVWIEFAAVAWEVGDLRRVAQASVRAISIAPDRFEGYMFKGLYEQEKGRQEQAIDLFREAAERAPRSLAPHLLLGRALENAGEPQRALEAYARALDIRPEDEEANALYRTVERRIRLAEAQSAEVRQSE